MVIVSLGSVEGSDSPRLIGLPAIPAGGKVVNVPWNVLLAISAAVAVIMSPVPGFWLLGIRISDQVRVLLLMLKVPVSVVAPFLTVIEDTFLLSVNVPDIVVSFLCTVLIAIVGFSSTVNVRVA